MCFKVVTNLIQFADNDPNVSFALEYYDTSRTTDGSTFRTVFMAIETSQKGMLQPSLISRPAGLPERNTIQRTWVTVTSTDATRPSLGLTPSCPPQRASVWTTFLRNHGNQARIKAKQQQTGRRMPTLPKVSGRNGPQTHNDTMECKPNTQLNKLSRQSALHKMEWNETSGIVLMTTDRNAGCGSIRGPETLESRNHHFAVVRGVIFRVRLDRQALETHSDDYDPRPLKDP